MRDWCVICGEEADELFIREGRTVCNYHRSMCDGNYTIAEIEEEEGQQMEDVDKAIASAYEHKPATLSAGQLAAEWDYYEMFLRLGRCEIVTKFGNRVTRKQGDTLHIETVGWMLVDAMDDLQINWLTPATPSQTDTPAVEGEGVDNANSIASTNGTREYWVKQALMWKQNFGELREELNQAEARNADLQRELNELRGLIETSLNTLGAVNKILALNQDNRKAWELVGNVSDDMEIALRKAGKGGGE